MKNPFYIIDLSWFKAGITGQSVILILGGLFLLYKSTSEIRHKVEGSELDQDTNKPARKGVTLGMVIF